jgi:hypothetical protein
MILKDYYLMGSVEKISGRESQRAWTQYELIGGKPPLLKLLWLWLLSHKDNCGSLEMAVGEDWEEMATSSVETWKSACDEKT